jgi:hypothetical protein
MHLGDLWLAWLAAYRGLSRSNVRRRKKSRRRNWSIQRLERRAAVSTTLESLRNSAIVASIESSASAALELNADPRLPPGDEAATSSASGSQSPAQPGAIAQSLLDAVFADAPPEQTLSGGTALFNSAFGASVGVNSGSISTDDIDVFWRLPASDMNAALGNLFDGNSFSPSAPSANIPRTDAGDLQNSNPTSDHPSIPVYTSDNNVVLAEILA